MPDTAGVFYHAMPTGVNPLFAFSSGYSQESDFICLPLFPVMNHLDGSLENCHTGIQINIHNDSIRFIPAKYPKELNGLSEKYGNLLFPCITDCGNRFVYNFPFQSAVYLCDKRSGEVTKYNPQSRYTSNVAKPMEGISAREKFEYESCALRFREVYYSDRKKVYFRIHHDAKERFSDRQRKSFLMIMDMQMNPLAEYALPPNFRENYFVYNDIIYFYQERDSDDMWLGVIDIEKLIE
jgi:hypothetical protein